MVASLGVAGLAAILPATMASAAPPPPAAGVAPGASASGTAVSLFYTAADGTVWTLSANGTPGPATQVGTGKVTTAVSAITAGSSTIVFGVATGNALWMATRTGTTWSAWTSLGGNLTSKPGAVFQGPSSSDYAVYARGTDGAVWGRDHISTGWGPWHSIGGKLLSGTGPSAAFVKGTYVLAVGTDKQLYLAQVGVGGFGAVGGQTTASPALTGITGAVVGFARGTDNVAYYHEFLSTASPGWHAMGGKFTSGLGAAASGTTTYTFGLGTTGQVYRATGTWTNNTPKFSGWEQVTG